jgi:hypothetical protein
MIIRIPCGSHSVSAWVKACFRSTGVKVHRRRYHVYVQADILTVAELVHEMQAVHPEYAPRISSLSQVERVGE